MAPLPPTNRSPQALDVALSGGTIFNMMRRLFGSVIRASVMEAVGPMFAEFREGQQRLDSRMDRIESRLDRIELRIDGLENRLEGLRQEIFQLKTEVAELRVDVMALKGDFGTLRVEVNSLERDRDSTDQLVQRVMRIENHLFARV